MSTITGERPFSDMCVWLRLNAAKANHVSYQKTIPVFYLGFKTTTPVEAKQKPKQQEPRS